MLTLILAESSLETIPTKTRKYALTKTQNRKGKKRDKIILDVSLHGQIMQKLPNREKRGRPDIIHLSLLAALGTPLNKNGFLQIFVHTIQDMVIKINPKTRLPKNYNRFKGLMEQLYELGKVPPEGPPLLTIEKMTLKNLIKNLNPSETVLFTEQGTPSKLKSIMNECAKQKNPVVIIGGFPHGDFSPETLKISDKKISIYPEPLDTWIVVSRVLQSYEEIVLEKNNHK
ncbi:MAG: 16S rRNA methyltransferase [Candidatus Lokiarchaeia archaeon]